MSPRPTPRALLVLLGVLVIDVARAATAPPPDPTLRRQDFTADPGWDAHRNRLVPDPPPVTRQDFGYRETNRAGGRRAGEVGGRVQRSAAPAMYAKVIPEKTLNDRLEASGRFAVTFDDNGANVLFGWFRDDARGWRTPNSLVLRLDGNGGKYWVFFEYCTRHWLAGGKGCFEGEQYQRTKTPPIPIDGKPHDWALKYDPDGNDGNGLITFTLDGRPYTLPLEPGHKADGATFNRFGLLNQMTTGGTMEAYFDDVTVSGETFTFDQDPGWEGRGNRGEFPDRVRRPLQDFGYSPKTNHAGGKPGEVGGLVWRDEHPAWYADRVGPLSLGDDELFASGTVAFTAAGSDSGVYLGWFDSKSKAAKLDPPDRDAQRNLLGVLIEGPSRIGHYFRPAYRASDGEGVTASDGPVIRPDGRVHRWSIRYTPKGADGRGRITVTFDDQTQTLELVEGHRARGATFDRFGLFNHQSGGNYVNVYLDDLTYTAKPSPRQ